jgi:hypothetical protein
MYGREYVAPQNNATFSPSSFDRSFSLYGVEYPAPILSAVFNPADFSTASTSSVISTSFIDANYLRYPVAQGPETLLNTIVNGTLGVLSTLSVTGITTLLNNLGVTGTISATGDVLGSTLSCGGQMTSGSVSTGTISSGNILASQIGGGTQVINTNPYNVAITGTFNLFVINAISAIFLPNPTDNVQLRFVNASGTDTNIFLPQGAYGYKIATNGGFGDVTPPSPTGYANFAIQNNTIMDFFACNRTGAGLIWYGMIWIHN